MTARLTTNVRRWSMGAMVEELPRLRARYGDAVADAAEISRAILADQLDQPRAQDVRRTLQAIADRGHAVPIDQLDAQTDCELLRQSWRLYGTENVELLPDEGLRQCAQAALQAFERGGGAPSTDGQAVRLVQQLLQLWDDQLRDVELQRVRDHAQRRGLVRRVAGGGVSPEEQLQLSRARRRLLRLVLHACGIKSGEKNVERLITEAGKVL